MKVGAFDYVLKPFNLQTMLPILSRAMDVRRLRTENVRLRQYVERLSYESPRYQMIGSSPAMQRVVQLIEKVAPTDATVLVSGQSGTGKELVARALHHNSPRRGRPLVTVNCAALQETLLESELFGHEKGAFTGAGQAKAGLIEVAEGGTLFIDEVAEMASGLQAKLLRVLEDGQYRRVGGTKECHANVRVIAATNKALEEEQKAGRFREDLLFRLNVVSIELPPLRERREDIPALVEHFLTTRQFGKVRRKVEPEAMQALVRYDWPGNIRELANLLERAQILAEDNLLTLDDLPESLQTAPPPTEVFGPDSLNLHEMERQNARAALQRAKGNKVHAAKLLGITRRAIYRLITKYGLETKQGEGGPGSK
jgi:DNA-binding NtrC family response regulator